MKRLFFIVVALVVAMVSIESVKAQSLSKMRSSLAERAADGSFVRVTEDAATSSALSSIEANNKASVVSGYRVVIYFDNGQYANDKAAQVLSGFRSRYPHINAYLVYESPYFKVSVGDCLTMEEAVILMNTFVYDYPKAFPKRENIRLSELCNVRVPSRDSVSINSVQPIVE